MGILALLYLGLAIYLGDQLCRRFLRYLTVAQRCATAVVVGLLVSTWFTYLVAWLFKRTQRPLLWADLCFFALAFGSIWLVRRRAGKVGRFVRPRVPGRPLWDWVTILAFLVLASWMMFATLDYKNGTLLIGNNEWSDFGPNTAIIQSFAVGNNFPTQYPHFSGETIRYHFLFYFQAGNLCFLGLTLPWSLNLLSIITLVSMLSLVMALGQLIFNSRTVGRLGAALFFFHGTLSFVAFLRAQPSLSAAYHSIVGLKDFLPSGFPYRGELWGIWTQVVFINQRHFASGLGVLLIALLFLLDRYRQQAATKAAAVQARTRVLSELEGDVFWNPQVESVSPPPPRISFWTRVSRLFGMVVKFDPSFVFVGCLLGLLPFWNALVFTTAFALLAGLFLLFPCRREMVALGISTAIIALPQLALLQAGGAPSTHPFLHWGYVIDQPTWSKIIRYIGFSFGLKLGLVAVALCFANWFQRRIFLILCTLFVMTFCLELSIETLANHKYLNIWLIISNLYVAYAAWRLWLIRPWWLRPLSRPIAFLVPGAIILGGLIDLFPIHNCVFIQMNYGGDPLVKWLQENTGPRDVFLTDRFVNHQILLAGRRIFYGWPSFSWSAGYNTTQRDQDYRQLLESNDPYAVFRLLQRHKIAYVAIDDSVRHNNEFIKRPNEELYALNFPKIWEDSTKQYGNLIIYKVPASAPKQFKRPDPAHVKALILQNPPVTMFQGGKGAGRGQLDFPRGITADRSGNILVVDSSNSRIQKFSAMGIFISIIGAPGRNQGEFQEPNGIAVDSNGNIYVADVNNHRVQKLSGDGRFIAEWKGPAPGFYGPRDVWITPDDIVYVVDQGRARIVKFDANGNVLGTWGSKGQGDEQFDEPTAVAVDPKRQRVYVADPHHRRIQVFDTDGKFVSKWQVDEWQAAGWSFQDLWFDPQTDRLYVTSPTTDEVLVFNPDGGKLMALQPKPPYKLEGASALTMLNGKLYVLCAFAERVTTIELPRN